MRTGVHCSVRKGFVGALEEAVALGCDAFQMFTQSPRGWQTRVYADEEFADFRRAREKAGLFPVVVHSPYLPNLSTSASFLYQKSVASLKGDLDRCEKLGAEYLVIHPGAYSPEADADTGLKFLTAALNEALAEVPGQAKILVENMAGGGRRMAATAKEMGRILSAVKNQKRIGMCFDTCHALAAGYDITNPDGVEAALKEFNAEVGLDRVAVFHVNDSKGELNSHRDMHQHLGKGHVGLAGLRALLSRKIFSECAFILETPKEPIPASDLENLRVLRSCLGQKTPAAA